MSELRCWPGALAYVVSPWAIASMHGMPEKVLRALPPGASGWMRSGHGWMVETGAPAWLCEGSGDNFPCAIADHCLRPLTPPPGAAVESAAVMEPSTAQWFIERHKRLASGQEA